MITAICNECGRVFKAAVILGIVKCPECGSQDVSVATSTDKHSPETDESLSVAP
jgi:predicted Zn-ribbon and HTH transcriptional regulator